MTEHETPLCYSLSHYNAQCGSNICINADRLPIYLLRTNCLPLIDTGISGMGVLRRHLPEGVLDDDRRIVAYTQFQKENALPTSGAEKVLIPLRCSVPAFVFHKGIIAAEIHGHRLATVRADRQKFRWYFHIFLPLDHFTDHGFVIESLLTARLTALEQAVISLRIEQPLFIKASLLKTVVYIGSAYSKSSPFRNTLTLCSSPSPIT